MKPSDFPRLAPTQAIAAMRRRKALLPDDYYGLAPEYRQHAFSIAGVTAADQLQSVLDSLTAALADGTTFDDWRDQVEAGDVGLSLSTGRLDNVFRTNLQGAYMRGIYQRQRAVQSARPYLMYDAINDGRTRPAHRALDNFIRPADDPIWLTHRPPLGYRCRCTLISLTADQARVRGWRGDLVPPGGDPDTGWDFDKTAGIGPGVRRAVARIRRKAHPKIVEAVERVDLVARTVPRDLDGYIAAGRQIADAMLAAAAGPAERRQWLLDRLAADVGTGRAAVTANGGKAAKQLHDASRRYPASWVEATDALGPLRVGGRADPRERGFQWTAKQDGWVKLKRFGTRRVTAGDGFVWLRLEHNDPLGNAVHEFAHRVQAAMPQLDEVFQQLHRRRTAADPVEPLARFGRYDLGERTRKDGYFTPYQGKEYKNGGALEVMTMALEAMLGGRDDLLDRMLRVDREMVDLVTGLLYHFKP